MPALQSYNVTSNVGYQRFCEGSKVELECPVGYKMVVLNAVYGRLVLYSDDPVCSHNQYGAKDTNTCQTNTTTALKNKCDGIQYCEVSYLTYHDILGDASFFRSLPGRNMLNHHTNKNALQ